MVIERGADNKKKNNKKKKNNNFGKKKNKHVETNFDLMSEKRKK